MQSSSSSSYQHCVLRPLSAPLREDLHDYRANWFDNGRAPVHFVIREASYGDEKTRVDLRDYFAPFARFGVPLCFSPSANLPHHLVPVDPVPGRPKHLTLDVEYDAYAHRPGGASLGTVPTRLRLHIPEHGYRWTRTECVVPRATLSVVVISGLANQMYAIMAACMIAQKTRRALAFPFRVLARNTALDTVCVYTMPPPSIDVRFAHLFDETAFLRCLPCSVVRTDDALPSAAVGRNRHGTLADESEAERISLPVDSTLPGDTKEIASRCHGTLSWSSLTVPTLSAAPSVLSAPSLETRETPSTPEHSLSRAPDSRPTLTEERDGAMTEGRLRRALLYGDVWKCPNAHVLGHSSSTLAQVYGVSHTHVLVVNPFFGVVPDTPEDYNACVNVFLSLRPAARLQTVSERLMALLKRHALSVSGSEQFTVVHCRQESDYPDRAQPRSFCESTLSRLREANVAASSAVPVVYMMGGSQNNEYWNATRQHSRDSIAWMRKEMFAEELPQLADLGFEEGALVDREIAIAAHFFIGFNRSTLSSATIIERAAHARPSTGFLDNPERGWLLDSGGRPCGKYTGTHPSVHMPSAVPSTTGSPPTV